MKVSIVTTGMQQSMIFAMTALRRYWPYLTLILAPLVVLWPAVLLGKAIGPFDQIRQMLPWAGPAPSQPWDVLQADGVLQFYLWRDLVFQSWGNFQVPFWNPYELAGTPLLANSQSAALYPPHILMGILHVPTTFAMTLLAWFHLAWAGLGTYFFSRKVGAHRVGGVVAGVSFSLSAFMVSWTGLPSVITTVAWIPWILGLTISLFRGAHVTSFIGDREPRSNKRYLRRVALLALCFGMLILAGHLQFVAYGAMASVLLALWLTIAAVQEKIKETPHPVVKGLGGFVLAAIVGAFIAAPQLLAVLNYSQFSHRQNTPSEQGYVGYTNSAIQPYELVGFMHSNLTGNPSANLTGIQGAEKLPAYWPDYVKLGGNFAEGAIGLGPMVIGLLLLARRRYDWRAMGGVALIAIVAFLLATGTGLNRLLYFYVPGWSATGSPGRISVLFVLAVCVLAGVSATQDSEPEQQEKWRLYVPIAGMVIVAIISIYTVMYGLLNLVSYNPGIRPEVMQQIVRTSTSTPMAMAAISTLVAAAAVGYWIKEKRKPSWALVAGAIGCLLLSVPPVLRFSDSADLSVQGPKDERIASINQQWDLLTAAPATLPPNTAGFNRIHELGGYDSLIHRETFALVGQIDPANSQGNHDPAPPANGNMVFVKPGFQSELLADAGVTEVWYRKPDNTLGKAPIKGPGRAYTASGKAEITSESTNQLVMKAVGPGTLDVKDRNMPGWTAMIDEKPTEIKGTLWRQVELPSGEHIVTFNYVAPGYTTGLPMAAIGWLLVIAGVLIPAGKRRTSTPEPEFEA